MEAYTFSKYDNYNHIYTYILEQNFRDFVEQNSLDNEHFSLNIDIDGNVSIWTLSTSSEKIIDAFASVLKNLVFDEKKANKAIGELAKKNGFSVKIKDIDLLISELSKIQLEKERPLVADDSLISPAIDFYKNNKK